MLLKQVNDNCYIKIKTPADVQLTAELQISGQLEGVTCFRKSTYVNITQDIYNMGYIELERIPSTPAGVTMFAIDGPILVNKAANGPFADFEVYNKYVFIRNNVSVSGYTSSDLTEAISVGDSVVISYGYSSTANLKQYSFTITSTDVSRGYAILPAKLVTPEFCMAFVTQGTTLTNRESLGNNYGDFLVYGDKFVIRNGVELSGYVSDGLSELISEGDTIVLLYL